MALEHLDDNEYEALKQRGLVALNDEAYERLKLPQGYGKPPQQEQPQPTPSTQTTPTATSQPGVYPATIKEEGATPVGPIENVGELIKAGLTFVGKQAGIENLAERQGGIGAGGRALTAIQSLPKNEQEAAIQAAIPMASTALGSALDVAKPAGKKLLAAVGKALPGLKPSTAEFLVNNSDEVFKAPSVKEATKDYLKGFPGLLDLDNSAKIRFGGKNASAVLDDIIDQADEGIKTGLVKNARQPLPGNVTAGFGPQGAGEFGPQEAFDGIHAINQKLYAPAEAGRGGAQMAPGKLSLANKELKALRAQLYDFLENYGQTHGVPEYTSASKAGRALKAAFVKEEAYSLLPRRYDGNPNVLKSLVALNAGLAATFAGAPMAALGSLAVSPAAFTTGIKAGKGLAKIAGSKKTGVVAGQALNKLNKKEEK